MSCIKSIQRGTGSGNATIVINEVDINKSVVLISGGNTFYINEIGASNGAIPIATLTDSTTIQVTNAVAFVTALSGKVSKNLAYAWQVIEFA